MRYLLLLALLPLASCEALRQFLAEQPVAGDPSAPAGGTLPQVGGGDAVDVIVTVLTMLGLLPAARMLMAGKPVILSLLRLIVGAPKQATPPAPPVTPEP
jgi:hypothetical protein